MLTSRQKLILKAIVEYYVEHGIPLGSKTLTSLPYLDFSSATIRYDMQLLEEDGYLMKSHTSSGRIPTQKGYSYYVNKLFTRDDEVEDVFPLIDEIFEKNPYEQEKAVREALGLLTDLTKYTAVQIGPDIENSVIKKIDFIPISRNQAILLIVTNHGHVQHETIILREETEMEEIRQVVKTLDDLLRNRHLNDAYKILSSEYHAKEINQFMTYQRRIVDSFIQAFAKFTHDNFYLTGLANVLDQPDYGDISNVKKLVKMLDRRDLVKLITTTDGLTVRFGQDIEILPIENMTVVSIPYQVGKDESGTIALFGPTRMQYRKIIPLLEYIAAHIESLYVDLINDDEEEDE